MEEFQYPLFATTRFTDVETNKEYVIFGGGGGGVKSGIENAMAVYEIKEGQFEYKGSFEVEHDFVSALATSNERRLVASGEGNRCGLYVVRRDPKNFRIPLQLTRVASFQADFAENESSLEVVAFVGDYLVTGGEDGCLRVWDLDKLVQTDEETEKEEEEEEQEEKQGLLAELEAHSLGITDLDACCLDAHASPPFWVLVSASRDETVKFWDLERLVAESRQGEREDDLCLGSIRLPLAPPKAESKGCRFLPSMREGELEVILLHSSRAGPTLLSHWALAWKDRALSPEPQMIQGGLLSKRASRHLRVSATPEGRPLAVVGGWEGRPVIVDLDSFHSWLSGSKERTHKLPITSLAVLPPSADLRKDGSEDSSLLTLAVSVSADARAILHAVREPASRRKGSFFSTFLLVATLVCLLAALVLYEPLYQEWSQLLPEAMRSSVDEQVQIVNAFVREFRGDEL